MDKLFEYNWPGNIRELENVLYRALKNILLERTSTIHERHIESLERTKVIRKEKRLSDVKFSDLEKRYLKDLLKRTEGNKSKAAKISGLGRTQIYTKLRNYGLINKKTNVS